MILLELKRYIRQRERVSLQDICRRFDLSTDAAEGLLAPLIQQGHIQILQNFSATSCHSGGCGAACQGQQGYYQWLEHKIRPLSVPIQVQRFDKTALLKMPKP
ncbi:hypothetical protein THMIRHAS_21480 [Thiosulfatimonas sediminis]|uniref:Transcriptional regulator HTH-type FeoC domain-containing protein n=1 Tax=Thiosulfatimonas sediminis TaxID=2675054 RepID=A0A6F8PXC1_9GAMM|nr:FeoC-like transcriptional regulator [Thiosulfatimonas sediminis]BBP46775.1 hypothetical protein THMIRHAS_21480 [Thiosulfatimonas sediminis]